MNCIYRLAWSDRDQALRAVAETSRGRRKANGTAIHARTAAAIASLAACGVAFAGGAASVAPPTANALPTAPTVIAGQATVTTRGNLMQVTESTNSAIINWGSFNIGSAASVNVVQPGASSVLLNRVLSSDPSQIFGTLTSNGAVFLVNAQGVIFGRGAEVNVGTLVASSLDITNQNFLAGNWIFGGAGAGTASAAVANAGTLQVAPGGFAALIGGRVENTGNISARLGSVALAAGGEVALDLDDAGLLRVAISKAGLDAQVQNGGAIIADGGRIVLTAKAAGDILASVVNNTGLLQAQGIGVRNGQVWLLAADPLGNSGATGPAANAGTVLDAAGGVASSGTIDVRGNDGTVTLAGTTVTIAGAIDAAGTGAHVLADSTRQTTLAAGGSIDVSGSDGHAVLWSDGATTAHGSIDGQGLGSGSGARVEVSAAGALTFDAHVALGAQTAAQEGSLLLDPATLEIAAGAGSASANTIYQNTLQQESGNIVLSATGQITIDALAGNALNLLNATSLSITSNSTGGIRFLDNASGQPSAIITHGAPVTLTASGSGSIDNVGNIATNGGDIDLSGVYVHLAGGLNATNGAGAPGSVAIQVFGGGLLSTSTSPIAGGQVTLDATYGYVGTAQAPVPTATGNLTVLTGGNAYVADSSTLSSLALTSNHLEGTAVGIDITSSNLNLTGADGAGNGTTYSGAVRWTQYSASVPGAATAPSLVSISEDGNLLPGNINLPASTLSLTSRQGYIVGGNAQPVAAATLNLTSPLGIGGTDFNGVNAETDGANPGSMAGNTLLIQAGTVHANVLDSTGSIAGIANLSQQGNLVGTVEASGALLQSTGGIGSSAQHFTVNVGDTGVVYNLAAGTNAYVDVNYTSGLTVANAQAAGSLLIDANSATNANGAQFQQVSAGGNATLVGTNNPNLVVGSIASTNGSIVVTGDENLEVDAATLNGTASGARSITLTSSTGTLTYGAISTDGPIASSVTASPVGTINLNAPQGYIEDLAEAELAGTSELRGGSAVLAAINGIGAANTAVDTATALTLIVGQVGSEADINMTLRGVDSRSDPTGLQPHAIDIASSTDISGNTAIANNSGSLRIGQISSFWTNGSGPTSGATVYLYAAGSIVPDGSAGSGAINPGDWSGTVALSADGSLGARGTGAAGLTGAGFLQLAGSNDAIYLTTGGDLYVRNTLNQGYATYAEYVSITANYAAATTPYYYDFVSGSAANILAGTPTVALSGASTGGLLTVTGGSVDSASNTVAFSGDGNLRISSFAVGDSAYVNFGAQNITVDPSTGATPSMTVGDNSTFSLVAAGGLNVGSLATGASSVTLAAQAGNLTLNRVGGSTTNISVSDAGGNILGAAGNRVLASNLGLTNTSGAIGADPALGASVALAVGVVNNLSLSNAGNSPTSGGGSINLLTLNDPGSISLYLATPSAGTYTGANFRLAPQTTGLGFAGFANAGGITLQSLGTTGASATAVPLSITVDTPSFTVASGSGPQLGIGYDLYFGTTYTNIATNLSGSAGQLVTVHADSSGSLSSLTGDIALTNLSIITNTLPGPLSVNYTLTQALAVLDITRNSGGGNDLAAAPGNTIVLAGAGQDISAVETTGPGNGQPGSVQLNATSGSTVALNYQFNQAGTVNLNDVQLAGSSSLTVGAASSGTYAPLGSVITSAPGAILSVASVNLAATSNVPGQASLGTASDPLLLDAASVALTTTGNIYATTGTALHALSITSVHPDWVNTGTSGDATYAITGPTLSLNLQDTGFQQTTLSSLTAAGSLAFSLTTDASITVGSVNAGVGGTVSLTSTAGYVSNGTTTTTAHTGIFQGSGSGISAGTVNLAAEGYQGSVGGAVPLNVAAPDLSVTVNGALNVADASALQSLALTIGHQSVAITNQLPLNTYALTAPNIALTLTDASSYSPSSNIDLVNLVSTSMANFSLTTTYGSIILGNYNGADYSAGQINVGSGGSVTITSAGSIWASQGNANYIADQASAPVASTAAAVIAGALSLNAASMVANYPGAAIAPNTAVGEQESIPVQVSQLSASGYGAYITNIGSVDITAASTSVGFFRVVEAAPGVAASITTTGTPLAGNQALSLVAYYGSIGQGGSAPVMVNTPYLDVESGANIAVHDTSALANLYITSNHDKSAINDISNGGLNAIAISDSGAGAMQLGATDLGVSGGGYQITGMNAPSLTNFSFTSDTSVSVGSIAVGSPPSSSGPAPLNPGSVTITSSGGSILQIAGDAGQVSAQVVTFSATTTGASVGLPGSPVRVNAPGLTVDTGGNMVVADASDISSFALSIGAVTDLGSTPRYLLDNSAAAHPITMSLAGDTTNNVLDINSVTVTRTDGSVWLGFSASNSSIGMGTITDNAAFGSTVSVTSGSLNVFGLGGLTSSTAINLTAGGSVGDTPSGTAAPVNLAAPGISVTTGGDLRLVSPGQIGSLDLVENNGGLTSGVWNVNATGFTLAGQVAVNGSGASVLDLASVQDTATNLTIASNTSLSLGTLAVGSGTLTLNSNGTIDSDSSNGATPNITSGSAVTLYGVFGLGETAQITTNIAGLVNLSTVVGPIAVDQTSTTPLNIGSLGIQYYWVGNTPVTITSAGTVNFTEAFSGGTGTTSPFTINAGGDANLTGNMYLNGAPVIITAGGNVTSSAIYNASSVSMTAGATLSVGTIDPVNNAAASGAITLLASGDIALGGQIDSTTGVSITSTHGSILAQTSDVFEQTANLTLSAAGDIGSGTSAALGALSLNGTGCYNPAACAGTTPLTLNVQAGGQVNLAAYSAVYAPSIVSGGNLNLQVLGDPYENVNAGITVGTIQSSAGSVALGTAQGNITAANGGGTIGAATAINLTAGQSAYWYQSGATNPNVYGIGSAGTPLALNAPQVSLTANGGITAQVPTTGLTDLTIARNIVPVGGVATTSNLGTWMPGGAIAITNSNGQNVLSITDGGWAPGGSSVVTANYGSALNLTYTSYDAIILGNVNLAGGNLSLGVYNASNISITSQGGLIQANHFSFNLNDTSGTGAAAGGFGTAGNPINTEITSLSGSTVGPNAGVFIDQAGPITFTSLATGGDIVITTTDSSTAGAGAVYIGNVTSNGGSVTINSVSTIGQAVGVNAPSISAQGASSDGGISLQAGAAINLGNTALVSDNAGVSIATAAGTITYGSIVAAGNVTLNAAAGVAGQATTSQGGNVTMTAQFGDIGFASILAPGGAVTLNANGNILGTAPGQNLTGLADGITAGGTITLAATNALGTAGVPLAINQTTGGTINLSSGAGYNTTAVLGAAGSTVGATVEVNSGGTLTLDNYYPTVLLDNVSSAGDLAFTQLSNHAEVLFNQVSASGPGATATFVVPYGDISADTSSSQVLASRIVLNALGDASGGTLGTANAVNVNADVVLAVASGNIALDSLATGTTKMPLVASNGATPTITLSSAGDFLVGQIVAGQQGTVNITSAGNIYDDQDATTRIHAANISLSAADAIGTAADPVQTSAQTFSGSGAPLPGTISAASTTAGSIFLDQQGDAVFSALTTANGAINVLVHDQAGGTSTLVLANAAGTDTAGNNINVTVSNGNLAVNQAIAGLSNGVVSLDTPQGSVIGIAQTDCCVTPNVVGSIADVTALQNVGQITGFATFSGTPLAIEAGQSTITSTATGAQVFVQYYGNAVVGSLSSLQVHATGAGDHVIVAACGNLSLNDLSLPNASLGLMAVAGSVTDGITGGASAATPSATAAVVNVLASAGIGNASDALLLDASTINASAAGGGVWINSAASTPVTVGVVTAAAGPVALTGDGNLLIGTVNAGQDAVTLTSTAGSVLDGSGGTASAGAPNITGGTLTLASARNLGTAADALWVNTGTINAHAADGGAWINSAAGTAVTVNSVTAANGPVVITGQSDLLIGAVNAGSGDVTLASVAGAILDGTGGAANPALPNVTAGTFTANGHAGAGSAATSLWVDADVINANAAAGGVWIRSVDTTPVTINAVNTPAGGPVVISGAGDLVLNTIHAGNGSVSLTSTGGRILDGLAGGASPDNPNITAGSATFSAATTVGLSTDSIWVEPGSYTVTSSGAHWVNYVPPVLTPYPYLPLINGVSPVTFYSAFAQSQITPAEDLPITPVGLPMQLVPPIDVGVQTFGLTLPQGNASVAAQQDTTAGTASAPIEGGNEDELGRKKVTLVKKSASNSVKDKTQP